MRNRGLTTPIQLAGHPAASCEYVLVPLLLRCLQIADQLSVSAVAVGRSVPESGAAIMERGPMPWMVSVWRSGLGRRRYFSLREVYGYDCS